jgi:hypothetical protein
MGSAQLYGRVWWVTDRTPQGEVRFENSGTEDAAEAQKIMADRALPRAKAMVARLEAIVNGEATDQGDSKARRKCAKQRAAGRDRGSTTANPRRGTRQEKTPRGEA